MNTYLKIGVIFASLLFSSSCSAFKADHTNMAQCQLAKHGELEPDAIDTSKPEFNSYLLDCSISVVVAEVSFTSGASGAKKRASILSNRMSLADFILSKPLIPNYQNEHGNTLIMSVVSSFFPEDWKVKTLKNLMAMGADKNFITANGDTALAFAKFKGDKKVIALLQEK